VTEIPEHLLKRSRAAKGTPEPSGDAAGSAVESAAPASAPASTGPAAIAAAAAAIPRDPEPAAEPDLPHYIVAANKRRKLPLWSFLLVAALPLWAISFAGTMQQPEVEDPLFEEAALVYEQTGGCSGCHGAAGGGGVGYKFTDGDIVGTFPQPIDQMAHVARGSTAINGEPYGDPDRAGGARVSGARNQGAMPAMLGVLSMAELELVIFHERAVLGGEDTESEVYQEWIEHLREAAESGEGAALTDDDLDLILQCSNPAYTPGASGPGPVDLDGDGENDCPGPDGSVQGGDEVAAG
jgi:hypothetical protein